MFDMDKKAISAIRVLAADSVQKANSGHPGLPLGAAPIAYELFAKHLSHNPKNPEWINRDRFILSAGHGSTLLYSLFHLCGYGDLSIDDLKNFRQLNSKTPGHPEYGHTVGVEATTGPLGAGMSMAVGMAIAEKHLADTFNTEDIKLIDHYTYVLGGDGCMMEGISSEAFSLAGTLGLDKLIVLYDSNNISIEGSTDIAFTEDVLKRMESFGFDTFEVKDGEDIDAIGEAIEKAKKSDKPAFIKINTTIGYGCPAKMGKASAHGEPLGQDNVLEMKKFLNYESMEPFYVSEEVYSHYKNITASLADKEKEWNKLYDEYKLKYKEKADLLDKYYGDVDFESLDSEEFWSWDDKPQATRNVSGKILNRLKDIVPNLIGGSADLSPSNKTVLEGIDYIKKGDFSGRNIHYGVRELAMSGIANGIALHGGLRTYCATFFVFSDYIKPMARLASLMKIPVSYVLTHDSIGVGEDGPTHEPIEQLAMLRAMPNFNVFRPADGKETVAAWYSAITSKNSPTALVLTRQNLPQLGGNGKDALKGGYILKKETGNKPELIFIASGSEVSLCMEAADKLEKEGRSVRVVSMPCMDIFEKQSEEYKNSVLPMDVRNRVAVEALSGFGLDRYTGLDGKIVSMTGFGASGPCDQLFDYFGFTVEHILEVANSFNG